MFHRSGRLPWSPAIGLLCVLLALAVAPLAGAVPAGAAPVGVAAPASAGSNEAEFLTRLNLERQARRLPLLVSDPELAPTSRSWSGHMASRGVLSHDPNLAQVAAQVEPSVARDRRERRRRLLGQAAPRRVHGLDRASQQHAERQLQPGRHRGRAVGRQDLGDRPVPRRPRHRREHGPRTAAPAAGRADGRSPATSTATATKTSSPTGRAARPTSCGSVGTTAACVRSSIVVNGHYRPVAGDFDGDGATEILWYVPGATADPLWNWNGSGWSATSLQVQGTYSPFVGDFDGDGADDIFWYGPGTAGDSRWYGRVGGGFTSAAATVNGVYQPVVGDLDGQHGDDILWYAPGSRRRLPLVHERGEGQRQLHVLPGHLALRAVQRRPRRQRHRRRVLVRAGIRGGLHLVHLGHPWCVPQRQPHGHEGLPACGRGLR